MYILMILSFVTLEWHGKFVQKITYHMHVNVKFKLSCTLAWYQLNCMIMCQLYYVYYYNYRFIDCMLTYYITSDLYQFLLSFSLLIKQRSCRSHNFLVNCDFRYTLINMTIVVKDPSANAF